MHIKLLTFSCWIKILKITTTKNQPKNNNKQTKKPINNQKPKKNAPKPVFLPLADLRNRYLNEFQGSYIQDDYGGFLVVFWCGNWLRCCQMGWIPNAVWEGGWEESWLWTELNNVMVMQHVNSRKVEDLPDWPNSCCYRTVHGGNLLVLLSHLLSSPGTENCWITLWVITPAISKISTTFSSYF